MDWLIIVIIAYFFNSLAMIIDKALLKKSIPEPVVYTFYIGVLGLIFIPFLLPFGFALLGIKLILFSLFSGIFFIIALLLFFQALKDDDASQVIPLIGGLNPIAILVFAYFLIGERLSFLELLALGFIISGSIIITIKHGRDGMRLSSQMLKLGLVSALFFGLSFVLAKLTYLETTFINGFIWTRLGALLAVFSLVFAPSYRRLIFKNTKKTRQSIKFIFLVGQALAGISFFMVNYAISLGSVTLTNALQGLQYAFLFILIIIISKQYPEILEEKINTKIIFQKILAIILISLGLAFIAF